MTLCLRWTCGISWCVEGVYEEAKVDADDDGSRNDEGEDEVIVDSKPAKI